MSKKMYTQYSPRTNSAESGVALIIALAMLAEEVTALGKPVALIGDGTEVTEKYFRTAGVPCTAAPDPIRLQTAYGVAMAAAKAEPGTADDIHPVYLRLSQAERERMERMKKEGEAV